MTAFVIAGVASGVGKTTVSLALASAFQRRGLRVQPFKCGPDFIDTSHHSAIAGRPSRNLDTWMLDARANREIFRRGAADADVAIVEGMMGLFDGVAGGTEKGSTAEIAKLLGLPVLLVLDASQSARSAAAVVKGFATFDPELRVAGVILNRAANDRHFEMLSEAIVAHTNVAVLGWLPASAEVAIPERHLGLRVAEEPQDHAARAAALAALAEKYLDIAEILALPQAEESFPVEKEKFAPQFLERGRIGERVRIGVARDEAFSFYYEDNFDLLREQGAELVFFSPLKDKFPEDVDALYLGGGYPELHAEALSGNTRFMSSLRAFAASGKPVYAECGGLMLLGTELILRDGRRFAMSGVLPIRFQMTERLVKFGYAEVELLNDCVIGEQGTAIRGHSFHYSSAEVLGDLQTAYRVRYSLSGEEEREGFSRGNVLGSYVHLHFRANPRLAATFVQRALMARSVVARSLMARSGVAR
jgi:cobyrinic acid a,c-diamide synthase